MTALLLLFLFLLVVVAVVAVQFHAAKTLAEQQVKLSADQIQQLSAQQTQTGAQLSTAKGQITTLEARLAPYLSLDKEKANALVQVQLERQKVVDERQRALGIVQAERQALNEEAQKLTRERQMAVEQLRTINEAIRARSVELTELEAAVDLHHFGYYQSHFDFSTSAAYQARLDQTRAQQKQMLNSKGAVVQWGDWEINGSKAEGRKQAQQVVRLVLRAFNGESDSAVARVRYNNILIMEQRIRKAYEAINSYTKAQKIRIAPEYLDLKVEELRLAHEYQEKVQVEREEQKRIREEMREEEIARREAERAQAEAEKEERRAVQALQKAQAEVALLVGEKQRKMQEQIAELERRLQEAATNKERAVAQAQLTKIGHVYVISNIGSFGEGIYKIGMTRRLDPQDRVDELGDASVPFTFDVHGIIRTDDAPALEAKLHRAFDKRRVNMMNMRKEFFRVSLAEIAEVVRQCHGEFDFVYEAEAKQYYETRAMLEAGAS